MKPEKEDFLNEKKSNWVTHLIPISISIFASLINLYYDYDEHVLRYVININFNTALNHSSLIPAFASTWIFRKVSPVMKHNHFARHWTQ